MGKHVTSIAYSNDHPTKRTLRLPVWKRDSITSEFDFAEFDGTFTLQAMAWLSPGEHLQTLQLGDLTRRFLVYVPLKTVGAERVPVHISFHGSNSNGLVQREFTDLNASADEHGFVVVYPYGTGDRERLLFWNAGNCCGDAFRDRVDDVGFIRAMLNELYRLLPVDADRIFLSGMSNGAMMAYTLAALMADTFAAVAGVAGPMSLKTIAPSRTMPVIHFHGEFDEFTPFEGGNGKRSVTKTDHLSIPYTIAAWVAANGCPPEPRIETLRPIVEDGTVIELREYGPGNADSEVVLYVIHGGGHTWPGRPPRPLALGKSTENLDANEEIWRFFSKHPRNRTSILRV